MLYFGESCELAIFSFIFWQPAGCLLHFRKPDMDKAKRPIGRPTKYKHEYAEQTYKLCLLGATDEEIANFFDVNVATINRWKNDFPEFCESIKKGKILADANIAERLYRRAMGYEAPDVDIRVVEGEIIETPLTKHYPPDTPAAIFWLKNRQRSKWRDKVDNEVSGSISVHADVKLSDLFLSDEE